MEYIIVRFPRKRTVYIDGDEEGNGETNERLRVEEGTHTINLGDPRDYTIATNYALTPEEVERLIALWPRLLDESAVFRRLVDTLK